MKNPLTFLFSKRNARKNAATLLIVFLFLLVTGGSVFASADEKLKGCAENLKKIEFALDLYRKDHNRYPATLQDMGPRNLRGGIPKCPAANKDTYSSTYRCSADGKSFSINCAGHHHSDAGVPANYPWYDYFKGLLLKPGHKFIKGSPYASDLLFYGVQLYKARRFSEAKTSIQKSIRLGLKRNEQTEAKKVLNDIKFKGY